MSPVFRATKMSATVAHAISSATWADQRQLPLSTVARSLDILAPFPAAFICVIGLVHIIERRGESKGPFVAQPFLVLRASRDERAPNTQRSDADERAYRYRPRSRSPRPTLPEMTARPEPAAPAPRDGRGSPGSPSYRRRASGNGRGRCDRYGDRATVARMRGNPTCLRPEER